MRCAGSRSRASSRRPSKGSATGTSTRSSGASGTPTSVGDRSRSIGRRSRSSGQLRRRRLLSTEEFVVRAGPDRPRPQGDASEPEPVRRTSTTRRGLPPEYPTLEAFLEDVAEILRRGGRRARPPRGDLRPARRASVSAPRRSDVARLLREPRLARRAVARPRARARQPRHRDHPGVTFGFHLCRGNQAQPLARLGRLRLARRAHLPAHRRRAPAARVRRRALGRLRAARPRARGHGRRARARDDEDRPAARRSTSWPGGSTRRARFVPLERLALSPAVRVRDLDRRERPHATTSGEARDDRRDGAGGLGMTVVLDGARPDPRRASFGSLARASRSSSRPPSWSGCGVAGAGRARPRARRPRVRDDDRASVCASRSGSRTDEHESFNRALIVESPDRSGSAVSDGRRAGCDAPPRERVRNGLARRAAGARSVGSSRR